MASKTKSLLGETESSVGFWTKVGDVFTRIWKNKITVHQLITEAPWLMLLFYLAWTTG